jgi:hypothetical protein
VERGHARLKRPQLAGKQPTAAQNRLEISIGNNPFAAVGIAAGIGFLYAMIRSQRRTSVFGSSQTCCARPACVLERFWRFLFSGWAMWRSQPFDAPRLCGSGRLPQGR